MNDETTRLVFFAIIWIACFAILTSCRSVPIVTISTPETDQTIAEITATNTDIKAKNDEIGTITDTITGTITNIKDSGKITGVQLEYLTVQAADLSKLVASQKTLILRQEKDIVSLKEQHAKDNLDASQKLTESYQELEKAKQNVITFQKYTGFLAVLSALLLFAIGFYVFNKMK